MGTDGVGTENGSGREQRGVLTETVEQRVIRVLGMELAQSRVDNAFLAARLQAIKEATGPMALSSVVTAGDNERVRAPEGYAFVRMQDVLTLQTMLA
jgi:hypothetical protein